MLRRSLHLALDLPPNSVVQPTKLVSRQTGRLFGRTIYEKNNTMASSSMVTTESLSTKESERLFEDESHATVYRQYSLRYENTPLLDKITTFLQEKLSPPYQCALDIGCGPGQSCQLLAPHFKKVIGVDCSKAQVAQARKAVNFENVTFRCGDERSLDFISDNSVDLVTFGEAIHWMDLDVLYPEVERILKPGGCLAAYGFWYGDVRVSDRNEKLEAQLQALHKEMEDLMEPYWSKKTDVLRFGRYTELPLPFPDCKRYPYIDAGTEVTVDAMLGAIEAYSAYQILTKKFPEKANMLEDYKKRFYSCISEVSANPESYKLILPAPICLVMSRKPLMA